MRLLVGIGNPGKKYEGTRHNVGFAVVSRFAHNCAMTLKRDIELEGMWGEGRWHHHPFSVLLPMTYMNRSGDAVARVLEKTGMVPSDLLVISDDVALPLGTLRIRPKGSSGGHNGLKSIEESVRTQEYARLRVGIGMPPLGESMEDFVLSCFTEEEKPLMEKSQSGALEVIEAWLQAGLAAAMQKANTN